jgi:PAS domain S-box-containing protein
MKQIRTLLSTYWGNYTNRVRKNLMDNNSSMNGPSYWRNRLFVQIIQYFFPFSLFVIIPGSLLSIASQLYLLAAADIMVFVLTAIITLSVNLSLSQRKGMFICMIYLIATILFFYLGSFGPGMLYFISATFFTALIFPKQAAYWSVFANVLICVAFGFGFHFDLVNPPGQQYTVASWVTVASNIIFLSAVVALLQHRLFDKLDENNERFNNVIKATSETIWDWDIVHDRMHYNMGMREMFGYGDSEVESNLTWWNSKIHPEDRERVTNQFMSFFSGGNQHVQVEYRFQSADGSYKYVSNKAFVVTDPKGNPIRMVGAIQDITETKNHITAIEHQNEKLQNIAWIQSHKVRAHVATILGLSSLLNFRKYADVADRTVVEGIAESCRRLDVVIQEINTLTKTTQKR